MTMTMRVSAMAAVAFGALTLAACGGSGDFKAKIQAQCEKEENGRTDCACAAETLDKELDAKSKDLLLAMLNAREKGSSPDEALKEAGVSQEEAAKLMIAVLPAMQKAEEACKKK